jgi:two-component system NtrC family sensor kinase
MFVTGYSLVKYEEAIDNELVQRLRANSREVSATIAEYERYLEGRRARLRNDAQLLYSICRPGTFSRSAKSRRR